MNKTNNMMSIFNITEERYKLLFGYENQYGIFHPKSDIQDYLNSHMYNLVYVSKYNSDTPSDVLKDISFLIRAGKFILHVNDIISIKMNGFTSSYRFCGILQKENDFILVSNFLKKEKDFYVKKIHKMNMVLNVPDARLIPINELNLEKDKIYCIEKETYLPSDSSGSIISDYSILTLKNNIIMNINPSGKPFVMIANALYYFMRRKKHENEALLLLNKHEFELIRDFHDLSNVKLVI